MGTNLKDIVSQKDLTLKELDGKTIAVDALNQLYMFLSTIRQPDGTLLMDSAGNTTSHLSGILYRTIKLLGYGIRPVYVFDGTPHPLKAAELARRREVKLEAEAEWVRAKKEGRIEDARKHAQRTSKFTPEMLDDSKKLLDLMGVPWIQAKCEGEAQCVHLCRKNEAWAVGSQDYDSLLFGAKRVVKGLSLSSHLELGLIELDEVLKELDITREQLIDIAILVGTDFDPGVKGIGAKKGLRAVKEGKTEELVKDAGFDLQEIRDIFLNPPVTDDYKIEFKTADPDGLKDFLCEQHDFSVETVSYTHLTLPTKRIV